MTDRRPGTFTRRQSDVLRDVGTRQRALPTTPQTQPVDARQVPNDSGGYSFEVDDLARLKRFLVLGVDSGTANVSARDLARQNASVVDMMIQDNAPHELADSLIDTIVDFSVNGRAPRQQPGLFALAMAASLGDDRVRARALAVLPQVARTGSTLFEFIRYTQQFRGWGRGLRRAVRNWYLEKGVAGAAFQAVKYRQRAGYSHRDLLRLAHPKVDGEMNLLFRWVTGRAADFEWGRNPVGSDDPLAIVEKFERLQRATRVREVQEIIASGDVTWEMLPDSMINSNAVWEALLDRGVPPTALMRQLPRLTRLGLLAPTGQWGRLVAQQLADPERLRRGRVHPFNVLLAHVTYAQGHSDYGRSTWQPERQIIDALDAAFYASYGSVTPTNRRLMLSLDVSGTMHQRVLGSSLTCRTAAAALSLITAATEDRYVVNAFTSELRTLNISPRQRLADVVRLTNQLSFGATDCALPMLTALRTRTEIDTFVVYTDSETNQNSEHPHLALQRYRREVNPAARLVVVAMTSTGFTIADPSDAGMLDLVGFDGALPELVSGFARGEF